MQPLRNYGTVHNVQAQPTGNRIAELRRARDMKLYDISYTLRVDPSTVSRWESGETTIPDPQKLKLAELFDVSVAYLMGWEERRRPGQRSGEAA